LKAFQNGLSLVKRTMMFSKSFGTLVVCLIFSGASVAGADDPGKETDPVFGGQILSLTEPKADVGKSTNPRFRDNQDGTVTDLEMKLVWTREDSLQRVKKWINWDKAGDYIKELNQSRLGGYSDWRLPTRKELASLYDESQTVPWNYYWTKNDLHIDPIFGNSHCCYWTGEELNKDMAWGFNFIRGKPYPSGKGGIQRSLSVIRAVRTLQEDPKG
jgi:hypothetical protein